MLRVNVFAFLIMALPVIAVAESLVVNVSGIAPGKGDVRVGVFNAPEQFPEGTYSKAVAVPGDAETLRLEVDGLEPGRYAVSVFQDFNGNEAVDKNFIGIPKEPYGFSGNWKSGSTSFEKAVIDVPEGGAEISIKMR